MSGNIQAQLAQVRDLARSVVILTFNEDCANFDGRVQGEARIEGTDEEVADVDVCGGVWSPFGFPRKDDTWIGLAMGTGLTDVYAMCPLTSFGGDDIPDSSTTVAAWTPPSGVEARVRARGSDVTLESDRAIHAVSTEFSATVGALKLEMKGGKVTIGNAAVELLETLSKTLGFIADTNRDLGAALVTTLIGPQPIITAPLFLARQLQIETLKVLFDQSLKG